MRKNRRRSYKFTGKTHSKRGILSFVLACISLLIYIVFVYLSYKAAGNLSTYYGAFGVLAMLLAIVSLVLSFTTLKEEDSFPLFPRLAVFTSVLTTIVWMGSYILGFIRG